MAMPVSVIVKRYTTIMGLAMLFILNGRISLADDVNVEQLIINMVAKFEAVADYTCRLDKRVKKNGILYEDLAIYVKYKKPKHYYFRWDQGSEKGREVIYVAGKYNDKLVAHPGGFLQFMTFHLDPEGRLAMQRNRHSLQHSGMEKIIHLIESNYQRAREKGMDAIQYIGEDRIEEKNVWIVEGSFPENQGFYAQRVIVSIDKTMALPVSVSIFDWSEVFVEEYVFRDLKINVGLNENDFNPGNPDYNFF
jgi:outer membrane lipoprotein-sorting protein